MWYPTNRPGHQLIESLLNVALYKKWKPRESIKGILVVYYVAKRVIEWHFVHYKVQEARQELLLQRQHRASAG